MAANVERLREAQNMNFKQLSERLQEAAGWVINAVGIRRIESGERRVTPDDLLALAVALQVSPVTLLMPVSDSPDAAVSATATGGVSAKDLFAWLRGDAPLPQQLGSAPRSWTLPQWFSDQQDALAASDVRWQVELQNKITTLENQMRELQARGDD